MVMTMSRLSISQFLLRKVFEIECGQKGVSRICISYEEESVSLRGVSGRVYDASAGDASPRETIALPSSIVIAWIGR